MSDNPNFIANMSSDEIYFGQDTTACLTDVVDDKADVNHTHTGYASQSDLDLLEDVVDTKASSTHTHLEYAASSHTHGDYATVVALDALGEEVDGKANASHTHTGYASSSHTHSNYAAVNHDHDEDYATIDHVHSGYATTTALNEVSTAVSGKANASHNHDASYDVKGAAASSLASANAYTDTKIDALVGEGASATLDTIGEISSAIEDNQDAVTLLNSAIGNKANASDLTSHTSNKSNPHNVTLSQLGVSATTTELNYVDGVTSNIQTQLNNKASSSHTHSYAGSLSAGGAATSANKLNTNAGSTTQPVYFANGVPVATTHTLGKSVPSDAKFTDTTYGNATTSTAGLMSAADKSKLDGIASGANAYTLPAAGSSLGGVKTGGDVTISSGVINVNDDSHNHVISNIDGLQTTLDGKAASGHTHNYAASNHTHSADAIIQMAETLFGTNSLGGVEYSYGSGSGKNILTEISNMSQGLHTIYAIAGTTGNPKTNESFRYLIHKTSGTIGWILAWDAQGSLFTNYQSAAGTFKGWKCVYDAAPSALWTGGYYMSSSNSTPQVVNPSKKLSECRNGWVLIWSDYDADTGTKNNTDIHHDFVYKRNVAGANWSGQCMLCDIPRYMGSNSQDVDTERRILKAIYIHDDRIEGSYQGSYDERNDVVLRAVYEF